MAPTTETSWGKILAICSSIGIPLLSLVCWLIVSGTQVIDEIHEIKNHQGVQDVQISDIWKEFKVINTRLDTISLHQHDEQFIYQRVDNNYPRMVGHYYIEKKIDGKTLMIPVHLNK